MTDKLPDQLGATARAFLARGTNRLLIGGKWLESRSGQTIEAINPATERVIGLAAAGNAADVDLAVAAARQAFESHSWSGMAPHDRSKQLLRIARVCDEHVEELAELETLNNGMPIASTRQQVSRLSQVFEYYAGWTTKIYGETNPSSPDMFNYTTREPLGVCGQIIPWNGPLMMAAWKIAPALACGNTVVLKPAEQTPLTAIRLGELLLEAGLPPGTVNVVTGVGETAGAALSKHPDVDKVAFTGSTEVGKLILNSSTGNLKRVTLELGGKSPNVIFDDADLDQAIPGAIRGFCAMSGQICVAGSRIFVQRGIYDKVIERLVKEANAHRVGDPFDVRTTMGPLISRNQFTRVNRYIDIGRSDGASVRAGGEPFTGTGYFVNPTLLADVNNDMRIAREEVFGPVAAVIPFDNEEDAVLQSNRTEFGLAAGVWTCDVRRAHKVARALRAGSVWVNTYMVIDPISPFGGYKQSGLGRELGRQSIDAYTETKSVFINLAR